MVYESLNDAVDTTYDGEPGFLILEQGDNVGRYGIYTDDGRGNGNHVADTDDLYWARRITAGLDGQVAAEFNHDGWRRP